MVRHANVVELMNDVSDQIKRRACRVAAPCQQQPILVGRTDHRREDVLILRYAIWFTMDQRAHPLPGAPTVDKRCSTVHRGVSHDGRFVVEVRVINNKKATETQELDRFGPSARHNTLLLWSVGLY